MKKTAFINLLISVIFAISTVSLATAHQANHSVAVSLAASYTGSAILLTLFVLTGIFNDKKRHISLRIKKISLFIYYLLPLSVQLAAVKEFFRNSILLGSIILSLNGLFLLFLILYLEKKSV